MIDLTAKSGDWRWAGAMGSAGLWVRGSRWNVERRMTVAPDTEGKPRWINDQGVVMQSPGPCQERWELWQAPPSVEPERVRWKLEWKRNECGNVTLRVASGVAEGAYLWTLPGSDFDGYRFFAWVFHFPDGSEHTTGPGDSVLYWSPAKGEWTCLPAGFNDGIAVYPAEVEMVKVEGGK